MKRKKKKPVGYIKLWRKMLLNDNWYNGEPFDERSAWIDLLLDANYTDGVITNNGKEIVIHRAEVATSERELARRWGWDKKRVRKFLAKLRDENQISANFRTGNFTHFRLINYDNYQCRSTKTEPKFEPKNGKQIKEEKEGALLTDASALLGEPINLWDDGEEDE